MRASLEASLPEDLHSVEERTWVWLFVQQATVDSSLSLSLLPFFVIDVIAVKLAIQ
jgi:hypothetical protein